MQSANPKPSPIAQSLPNATGVARGHFAYESGHHGNLWLDLDALFVDAQRARGWASPTSKRQRSSKPQISKRLSQVGLKFGSWNFSGGWSLVLGAFKPLLAARGDARPTGSHFHFAFIGKTQGHDCPTGGGGGYPRVASVREAAVHRRLKRKRAAMHEPCAVPAATVPPASRLRGGEESPRPWAHTFVSRRADARRCRRSFLFYSGPKVFAPCLRPRCRPPAQVASL